MNFTHEDYISFSDFVSSRYNPSLQRKLHLPLSSVCFVVGLVGNLLVIFAVVKSKRLHNAPCLLLANLAVADLLTIMVMIPLRVASNVLNEGRPWNLGGAWCRLEPYIHITLPVSSILTMVAISIERYYVVLHPLRAKSFVTMGRVKKVIVGIWIISCILTIPALLDSKTETYYLKDLGLQMDTYFFCVHALPNWIFRFAFDVYFFLLVFFIPLIIVSYIYIRIGVHLNRTRKGVGNSKDLPVCSAAYRDSSGWSSGSHMTSQMLNVTSEDETEMDTLRSVPSRAADESSTPRRHRTSDEDDNMQRVIRVLAVVVALFILTWGPLMTFDVVSHFLPNWYPNYDTYHILIPFLIQLAALNSCINPIIYAFLSKTFRQSFKEVIGGCCCFSPLRNNAG